ncbi:MAG TPA: hypothetical protein DE036_10705 [Actinobacteria bacterium]|nr:hypothetical protein [Actinomycetota bacterium]
MAVDKNNALEEEIKLELANSQEIKDYAEKVKTMDKGALEAELARLDDALEDAEDEMKQMIRQTGVHVYAVQIEASRDEFEREKARISEKKRLVNEAL